MPVSSKPAPITSIDAGLDECRCVGNLKTLRHWGHARRESVGIDPSHTKPHQKLRWASTTSQHELVAIAGFRG
jgi:hypothetical protein